MRRDNHALGAAWGAVGVEARRNVLTGVEIELAQRLSEKHRSRNWIYRMDDKRRRVALGGDFLIYSENAILIYVVCEILNW